MQFSSGKVRLRVIPLGGVYASASNRAEDTAEIKQDDPKDLSDKRRWQRIVQIPEQQDLSPSA